MKHFQSPFIDLVGHPEIKVGNANDIEEHEEGYLYVDSNVQEDEVGK